MCYSVQQIQQGFNGKKAIEALEDTLVTLRTNPSIITVWTSRLLGWQDQIRFPFSQYIIVEKTYQAVNEQDSTNWNNFLMGRLRSNWIDAQTELIVMISTKRKRSSKRWMRKAIIAVWEVCQKQWEHRNTILHDNQYLGKQRELRDIDTQIQEYRMQYQSALYLPKDQALFLHSEKFIHKYPTLIKQQWLQSVATARLRKVAADTTPVSQERRRLTNWIRNSDQHQLTTTNEKCTVEEERRSFTLFARPLTRKI